MPNLLIRDIPQELFDRLKARAEQDRRSVPAEATYLLADALDCDDAHARHRQAMKSILERAKQKQPTTGDSTELLREDRER